MKFYKKTVGDVPLSGKTVLVRTDYNVPLNENGEISDDFRIRASLPTITYLLERGCKVVIMSHLGRPGGKEKKYTLEPVAERLAKLLKRPVLFVEDCVGPRVKMAIKRAPKGSLVVLENLRFYDEEEKNSLAFAKKIVQATAARYFVQDGFGVVHRAHASTAAITLELPGVAGLLLEKEVTTITKVMRRPKQPLIAVLGGAKVSDKLPLIEAIIPLASQILIGGAMANTFLAAKGLAIGKSKFEQGQTSEVDKIYELAAKKNGVANIDDFIVLPSDVAVATEVSSKARRKNVAITAIGDNESALDIGDKTIEDFVRRISQAQTVIWNGTLGLAEFEPFAHGSARLALALATQTETTSIIGGGDTADFVRHWDGKEGGSFTHVSTGGGASLELMAGEKLPGVESLLDA